MNLGDMVECFEGSYDSTKCDHEYDQHSSSKVGRPPPGYFLFRLLQLSGKIVMFAARIKHLA